MSRSRSCHWLEVLSLGCCLSLVGLMSNPSFAETPAEREAEEEVVQDRSTAFNPDVLTVHRQNYFLPLSTTTALNRGVYDEFDADLSDGLTKNEVKFQFSAKVQANQRDLLLRNDAIHFALTLEAWWQLYSSQLSSPFRETNYTPEIFYVKPVNRVLGGAAQFSFGLRHQSNGQGRVLSRSWNRLVAGARYERDSVLIAAETWYRIPERSKNEPDDVKGDDNPDIEDFVGYGSLRLGWRGDLMEASTSIRGNPSTGKGGIELQLSFPLFNRFRGLVEYYNGYGESLIDYDRFQQRVGVGVLLSDFF